MANASDYFCGFKTAFFVGDEHDNVGNMIVDADKEFFAYMSNEADLPEGWELEGVEMSGAAGFVVTFNVNCMPNEDDMLQVKVAMDDLEEIERRKAWATANVFDAETFQDWSIYDTTDAMLEIAKRMWDDGDKDYGNISERLSVDSRMTSDYADWTPAMIGKSAEDRAAMSGAHGSMKESLVKE